MKKVLIVTKDEAIREVLRLVCAGMKFGVVAVDHEDALSTFLTEEPAAIIVCDYDERGDKKYFKGTQTFQDIRNSATNEVVLRMGFSKLDHSDYLQLPLNLKELKKKINKKGGK